MDHDHDHDDIYVEDDDDDDGWADGRHSHPPPHLPIGNPRKISRPGQSRKDGKVRLDVG